MNESVSPRSEPDEPFWPVFVRFSVYGAIVIAAAVGALLTSGLLRLGLAILAGILGAITIFSTSIMLWVFVVVRYTRRLLSKPRP